jgi:site-specific DNA-methyltransferase (adenine-specific)
LPDNYFDLAIPDPPYGINLDFWDENIPDEIYFKELFRVSKKQMIFGGNYFNLPHSQGWICWDKTFNEYIRGKSLSRSPIKKENISEFELIWTSFLKKSKFIRYMNLGNLQGFNENIKVDYKKQPKIHICEKPLKLYEKIFTDYAEKTMKVLDTHGGSCNSAIVGYYFGFSEFVVCEKDKSIFQKAVNKFEVETMQQVLSL